MAVEVPRVNRFQPQQSQSVGRINPNVPDFTKAYAQQAGAIEGLADRVLDQEIKEEQRYFDTKGMEAAYEIDNFIDASIDGENGLKYYKGDPNKPFADFEDSLAKKREEILAKYEDMSEAGKAVINEKLNQTVAKNRARINTTRGTLYNAYEGRITEDSINSDRRTLVSDTEIIDINDPSSFIQMDQTVARMIDTRWNYGRKVGLVTVDKDGQDIPSQAIQLQTAKDIGEGLYDSISNLNAIGEVEKAKAIRQRYEKYLKDPEIVKKLNGEEKKGAVKVDSLKAFEEVRSKGLQGPAAVNYLNKNVKDVEVREEALSRLNDHQRRVEQIENRAQKDTYDVVSMHVLNRMASDQPYQSVNEMMRDNFVATSLGRTQVNARQMQALQNLVQKPKSSNQDSIQRVQQAFFDGETRGMAPSDFAALTSGLSDSDYKYYRTRYDRQNSRTEAQQGKLNKDMQASLEKYLIAKRYISPKRFGQYSKSDLPKVLDAQKKLMDQTEDFNPNASPKEIDAFIDALATSIKQDEIFVPPPTTRAPRINGGSSKPQSKSERPDGSSEKVSFYFTLSQSEKIRYRKMYFDETQTAPDTNSPQGLEEFEKYVKGKQSNGQ